MADCNVSSIPWGGEGRGGKTKGRSSVPRSSPLGGRYGTKSPHTPSPKQLYARQGHREGCIVFRPRKNVSTGAIAVVKVRNGAGQWHKRKASNGRLPPGPHVLAGRSGQ